MTADQCAVNNFHRAAAAGVANAELAAYVLRNVGNFEARGQELDVAWMRVKMPTASWREIGDAMGLTKNQVACAWRRLCVRNNLEA